MKTPSNLKHGDKIGLASTARKIIAHELNYSLAILKDWGLVPVVGKSIDTALNQYAGSDEQRTIDFQEMLDNPEIKAILCARGGYGTVRIVDQLDFTKFIQRPKWLCGFSDITVMHAHINQNFGIETIHAAMPITFQKNTAESLGSLKKVLFGESVNYEINSHPLNRVGKATGILVGGNLSVLYSISGSKSELDTEDKILFLEDLDEYLYHIDRMMMQMKRSGKLENLAGLIIGGMSDMNDNKIPFGKNALEIIKEHVAEYSFPVAFDFPAGHIDDNRALVMGRKIDLVSSSSTVQLNS